MNEPTRQSGSATDERKRFPLVSVIIPFYKQDRYLEEAIRSVADQSYPNVELIVVDDGSPVAVAEVIGDLPGVTVIRTENRGVSAARNTGSERSSGEYLIFLDADDRLAPGAIEAHMAVLAKSPSAGLCFGARRVIDPDGQLLSGTHICRPRRDYFLMLLETNPIGCPGATMMRREAFEAAGGFDPQQRMAEEYDLYLRMARKRPILRHTSCVLDYRVHSEGVSQNGEAMLKATIATLDRVGVREAGSPEVQRRLQFGRRKWTHIYRPEQTAAYKARTLYYSFRAMLDVPVQSYFRRGAETA